MKAQIKPCLIASLFFLCSSCGNSNSDGSLEDVFNGRWRGVLTQTESDPVNCDKDISLKEIHDVSTFPPDIDGFTVSLAPVSHNNSLFGTFYGRETSGNSFEVETGSATTQGLIDYTIDYQNVSNGSADVTFTRVLTNCASVFKGTMHRDS
jgi:hypothetical protein